jgi:hypothetical protein
MNVAKLESLSQELDYQKKTFGGLQHRAALGVASYQAACRKYARMDLNINKVKHTIGAIQVAVQSIQTQVEHMQGGLRFAHSHYPFYTLMNNLKTKKNFILVKACPLCQDWFHANDIIVASCGHTYHLFCLFSHLQNSSCTCS